MEVCNPLAGHAGIHKLGKFLFMKNPSDYPTFFSRDVVLCTWNLRPELRSTQRAIQLIACVECPVLEKYGFEKVFAPFIKDVNTLSNVRVV